MNVNVLLSGRLRIDGYGRGMSENPDHTYRLFLPKGSTVQEVIQGMNVPPVKVTMTMINGRKCNITTPVEPDDRVILIPPDVVLLWRHLEKMNLGVQSVFDF